MARMLDFATQLDFVARLVVAAALGALVGAEREIHGHPAGIRTHMLVALGSGIFTVMSIHGFGQGPGVPIDPTRIAAQIVSGIGFLGAGAILKDGIVIRGLTTAASLWATSAVGMAAGAGEYVIAGVATATIVWSTRIMKKPSTSAQSAGHGFTSPVAAPLRTRAVVAIRPLHHCPPTAAPIAVDTRCPATGAAQVAWNRDHAPHPAPARRAVAQSRTSTRSPFGIRFSRQIMSMAAFDTRAQPCDAG
jgi:hypothetical protein